MMARPLARPLPEWAERLRRRCLGGRDVCPTKVRFSAEANARNAGHNRLRNGDTEASRFWVYPCVHCRGWHLTTQPNADVAISAETSHDGVAWS